MELPRVWFERIVETLDAAPAGAAAAPATQPAVGEQRRREPRVGVRASVTLIPLTEGQCLGPWPVTVPLRDLSGGGIGFLHSGKVDLDEQFVALLPYGDESVAVLCQVAYYQPLGERAFAVGAKFLRVLRQPAGDDAGSVRLPNAA
jgi:hypothetical protein